MVISLNAAWLPCDFLAVRHTLLILIRVRRIKYRQYALSDIELSCDREIAALRGIPVVGDIARELWVRGPDRYWFRYRILADRIEGQSEIGGKR